MSVHKLRDNKAIPKVSIIILNWNGLEDTIECLKSLKKISYPDYEVIVVDNDSEGNDAQVLREKFGDYIHLIENDRNYGFARGNNIGIKYALNNSQPDYLLLLNNDTVVAPEFLTEMVEVAVSDPAIGVVGAKICDYDKPNQLQFVRGKINLWRGEAHQTPLVISGRIRKVETDRGQYDSVKDVDWTSGCCLLTKKQVLGGIGLLDESYFFCWEDTEYCTRAKKAGYRIIHASKAKVWHKHGQSVQKISGFARYYYVRNRFRFMRKHASKWQYRCFLIYFFGFYFWLVTGYYLIYIRSLSLLTSFYRGTRDGLFDSESGAKVYTGD